MLGDKACPQPPQPGFQFIPKVFDGVEVGASLWTWLCARVHCHVEMKKGPSPSCCHKVGNMLLSNILLSGLPKAHPCVHIMFGSIVFIKRNPVEFSHKQAWLCLHSVFPT